MIRYQSLDISSVVHLIQIYGSHGTVGIDEQWAAPIYEPRRAKMTITVPIRTVLCGVNLSRKYAF